jgi:hypothetical protein
MVTLRVRVPKPIYEELLDRAEAEVDTVSHVVRQLIHRGLKRDVTRDVARDNSRSADLARAHEGPGQGF